MIDNIHAYTSITTNYLPKARVLARSLKKHNPDVLFHLLISDDLPASFKLNDEPFDSVIYADELDIPDPDKFFFTHTVVELCTAVKGLALEYIFKTYNADTVFYFDPDMAVFSSIQSLLDELDNNSILLTPHQTEPEKTSTAIIDNEMCSLRYGVFNLGFVGVKNDSEGRRFSQWWCDRLVDFCFDDVQRGLFTDQKWVNLAPCFFSELKILRDPIYNVATWNLTSRKVTGTLENGIFINEEPLCFYHFSGFDSGAQEYMLKKYGAENPALYELRNWYIDQCQQQGQDQIGDAVYKYGCYSDGTLIKSNERIEYRTRADLQERFEKPFEAVPGKPCYRSWYIDNQSEVGYTSPTISISSLAGFKDVFFEVANYFYSTSYSERVNSSLKRFLLRNFARFMFYTGKILLK